MNPELFDMLLTVLILVLVGLGILFAFFPRVIVRINRFGNKILFRDEVILSRLRSMGVVLVILSVLVILNIWIQI